MANALGVPPDYMLDAGREHGITVAALVGAREHAVKQVNAGVDLLIAQGTEAGGHCGEVSTLVLVPEVLEAVAAAGSDMPVLAAAASSPDGRWRRAWPWARPASGPGRCG